MKGANKKGPLIFPKAMLTKLADFKVGINKPMIYLTITENERYGRIEFSAPITIPGDYYIYLRKRTKWESRSQEESKEKL